MENSNINTEINVSVSIPLDVAVHLFHMSHRWEVHQRFGFENVAEYAALKHLAASFFQNEAVVDRIMTETYWSSADEAYAEASIWARNVSEHRLRSLNWPEEWFVRYPPFSATPTDKEDEYLFRAPSPPTPEGISSAITHFIHYLSLKRAHSTGEPPSQIESELISALLTCIERNTQTK